MIRERTEHRLTKEDLAARDEIPHVIFHDLSTPEGVRGLTIALKKTRGRRLVSPRAMFPNRTARKAEEEGIYRDKYEIFSRDALALGRPKGYWDDREEELAIKIAEDDDPGVFIVAELSWRVQDRFLKIHREEEYDRVRLSRSTGIDSPEIEEARKTKVVGTAGQGVGSPITKECARAGFKNLIAADGGVLSPHDGNRQDGPFISSIGENHAIYTTKQVLELDPFINIDCIPKNLRLGKTTDKFHSLEDFVSRSDFIFDEMDDLKIKAMLRYLAWEMRKPVAQITDLGRGVAVQFEDPGVNKYPCNGRLTPEVFQSLMEADLSDYNTFMYFAKNIFMGAENIRPEVEEAFRKTQERNFFHIPQSGISASKAGATGYELLDAYYRGVEISTEKLIGYDWSM